MTAKLRIVTVGLGDIKVHLTGRGKKAPGETSLITPSYLEDPELAGMKIDDLFEVLGQLPVSAFLSLVFSDDFPEDRRPEGSPCFADIVRIGNDPFAVVSWRISPPDPDMNHPGSEMTVIVPIDDTDERLVIMTAWYKAAEDAARIKRVTLPPATA